MSFQKTQKAFYCPITKAALLGQSKGPCQRNAENPQASTPTQKSFLTGKKLL